MAKLTLTDITAGHLSVAAFNANNSAIEAALENTLSRDGTSPNTMSANLDMNSNKVVNLVDGTNNQDAVTVAQLNSAVLGGAVLALDDLTDVVITSAANGEFLRYNGTNWVDAAITEADISDLGAYLSNIVEDTTPQLGGDLDAQSNSITTLNNLTMDGTLTIQDATNADTITATHDGTYANFTFFQTTACRFTGVTAAAGYTFDADIHCDSITLDSAIPGVTFEVSGTERASITALANGLYIDVGPSTAGKLEIIDGLTTMAIIDNVNGFTLYETGGETDYFRLAGDGTNFTITTSGVGYIECSDNTFKAMVLRDLAYESASEVVSANAVTLTYTEGPSFEVDLEAATGAVTITISGGPVSGDYGIITVKVQQDSTADRTITWAGGTFVWAGGSAHVQQTGSDAISIYTFETWDGGTTWYATGADYS